MIAEEIISQFEREAGQAIQDAWFEFIFFLIQYCQDQGYSDNYIARIITSVNKALKYRGLSQLPVGCLNEVRKESKKRSKTKKKYVPKEFIQFIADYAKERPCKIRVAIAALFIAGIAFGLKPVEWMSAKFVQEGNRLKLVVKNAKYDQEKNKAHGEYRTIWINNPEACTKEIQAAQWLIDLAQKTSNWEKFCFTMAASLAKIRKKAGIQQRVTIYSARHQFAANAKKYFSKTEVSAMLGHSITETAIENYGKRLYANDQRPNIMQYLSPDPADVARIQKNHTPYPWL